MKNKIYLKVPANYIAGGVESLFQLSDAINNCGGRCLIIFDKLNSEPIPQKYSHYNVEYLTKIEDVEDVELNWIIYPEVWTEQINEFKNLKKCIWWLSVDNNHGKYKDFCNSDIIHFYQSFYALNFLQRNGAQKCLPLFDYISTKYTESGYDISVKENIVCYNPVKGTEVTNQIKFLNNDVQFIPIVNMDETQIINLLKKSKIYIDFGHHPGRDRIPRESAILGNCVLTNLNGSAGFYSDIPIDNKYKISNIESIGTIIRNCFKNYETIINDFSLYRSSIKNQKEQLHNLTKQFFL